VSDPVRVSCRIVILNHLRAVETALRMSQRPAEGPEKRITEGAEWKREHRHGAWR